MAFESKGTVSSPQLALFEGFAKPTEYNILRPIHYLGSKLRVSDAICNAVEAVDPTARSVCDLFSGSGTMAYALSRKRNVVAVDIQEYSRVLCSAVLSSGNIPNSIVEQVCSEMRTSENYAQLAYAVEPLARLEADRIGQATRGNLEPLCDLLDQGSILGFEQRVDRSASASVREAVADTIQRLADLGLSQGPKAQVTRYFGGIYFSYKQAAQLDSILEAITVVGPEQHDVFLAAALSTASEIVNTIGKQFAQPLRPRNGQGIAKRHLVGKIYRDRSFDAFDVYEMWLKRYLAIPWSEGKHTVLRKDYREALQCLPEDVGVVYADPPYTRDHYSRYYHVLETLCLRDNPPVSTIRIHGETRYSRGFYRLVRHQSPFCIKSQAPAAFSSLFKAVKRLRVPLVLSYSPFDAKAGARPRLMTIDAIQALASQEFHHVQVVPAGPLAHNKLNSSEHNVGTSQDAEILIICRP
ncbi:MAG: DNA adenine methylase [Dehalococcoidia bacterium]|nr:DNA adenine methylase [Dehalococcoidia bacterium]